MNIDFLLKRFIGKATCRIEQNSKITKEARILNASGNSDQIYIRQNSIIKGELFVFAHGGQINIGDWCFIGEGTRIWSATEIEIENRVMISHNVNIFDSLTHPINSKSRHDQFKSIISKGHPSSKLDLDERPVRIASDTWIGAGSIILKGVTIGEGSIVGAGSVVTKDVSPYTIFAGNPARIIRSLTEDECRETI